MATKHSTEVFAKLCLCTQLDKTLHGSVVEAPAKLFAEPQGLLPQPLVLLILIH